MTFNTWHTQYLTAGLRMIDNTGTYYENIKFKNQENQHSFAKFVPLKEHAIFKNCDKIFKLVFWKSSNGSKW